LRKGARDEHEAAVRVPLEHRGFAFGQIVADDRLDVEAVVTMTVLVPGGIGAATSGLRAAAASADVAGFFTAFSPRPALTSLWPKARSAVSSARQNGLDVTCPTGI